MTPEIITLIAEMMVYLGLIISTPFLYRVGKALGRYFVIKFKTRSEIVLIDESGAEIKLITKRVHNKEELIALLRKGIHG
jgi:hypothetical protein